VHGELAGLGYRVVVDVSRIGIGPPPDDPRQHRSRPAECPERARAASAFIHVMIILELNGAFRRRRSGSRLARRTRALCARLQMR
jgi:hypothetical protein